MHSKHAASTQQTCGKHAASKQYTSSKHVASLQLQNAGIYSTQQIDINQNMVGLSEVEFCPYW